MKKYLLSIFAILFCLNVNAQYISSTTEQIQIPYIAPGSNDNPIIRIRIDIGATPIELYALFLSTNGSNNPVGNIDNIKVYITGSNPNFSTNTLYTGGNFPLPSGVNYFWVAYDLYSTATPCDTIDAECTGIYATNGTQAPTVTAPAGYSIVTGCPTSVSNLDADKSLIKVYPNPSSGIYTIEMQGIDERNSNLEIFNLLGEKLHSSKPFNGNLDLRAFPKGVYYLKIKTDHQTISRKLILQ